jgi:hypothetical protein
MSKFDTVLNKISENLPVPPQQQPAGQPTPTSTQPVTNNAQQPAIDPKIMQELIAAKNEQQVQLALQKLQATQQVNKTQTTTV